MLDLGWQEFVMIGLVLVLVVGPKDMPRVLKAAVKSIGKVRGMAREFQTSMMEVADQDEFKDVKKALSDVRTGNTDALAEFEKVKKSVTNNYVPGFSSDIKELKEGAIALKADANKLASADTLSKPKPRKSTKKVAKKTSEKAIKKLAHKVTRKATSKAPRKAGTNTKAAAKKSTTKAKTAS